MTTTQRYLDSYFDGVMETDSQLAFAAAWHVINNFDEYHQHIFCHQDYAVDNGIVFG